MADQPTKSRSPRASATAVRGFLNLSASLPDLGASAQQGRGYVGDGCGRDLHHGLGNTIPVVAMAAKQASPTAYRCIERRAQFLVGTGFPVPERDPKTGVLVRPEEVDTMGDTPVPGYPGKTANDFWAELCSYVADFNGAAVLVRYNNGNTIGETHILPFASVRKTTNGTYLLNHKFGRKGFKATDTTEHQPFNPDKKVVLDLLRQAKVINPKTKKPYGQPGQIFFIYTPKAGEEDYPLPPQWPGLESLFTEAAYANFDLTEVRRGFRAKGILTMLGEADDQTVDEHGLTEKDRQDELLRRYTVAGAQEQGAEREDILVLDVKDKEQAPIWTPMNTTTDLKWLSDKKEAVGQEICRHIGIPPILAGFAKPGQLGTVQELVNAAQLTQNSLNPTQKMTLRAFWRLFPSLAGVMPGQLNPVEVATQTLAAQS
jgi:hypothetical protein